MKKETFRDLREWAYYGSLGMSVAFSVFIGLFSGIWLDKKFDTAPTLMLIFLAMGIAAGFRNIHLAITKSQKAK